MRRYSLNVPFLLLTLVPLLLAAIGIHFLHASQSRRNIDLFVKKSLEAEQQGDPAQAIRYLYLYLPHAPRDGQSIERLGNLLLSQAQKPADYLQPFLILERALRLDPEQPALRRQVAELAMRPELRRYKDAQGHLEVLLKDASVDSELLTLLAECQEKDRRYPEAAETLARLIALDPHKVSSYVGLARLYRSNLDDPARADRVMDAREPANGLVTQNPDSFQAHLERASYRRQYGIPGAEGDIARARELAPDDPDTLFACAELAIEKGQLDDARADLEKAVKARPRDVRFHLLIADVERQANQPEQSSERLRQGITAAADDPLQASQLRWALAGLLIDNGQLDEARQIIPQLDPAQTRKSLIDYLEARLLFADGKWYAASQAFEKLSPELRDQPALAYQADLLLAQCYDRLGNPDRRLAVYRRALEFDRAALPARLGMAATLVELDKRSEAIAIYRDLAGQVPGLWFLIARLQAAEVLDQPPNRRDWREVDRALDEAARQQPGSTEVALLRAGLLANRGELEAARADLVKLAEQHPEDPAVRLALASLATTKADPPREEPETLKALDDSLESRLARVRFWADAGGPAASPALAKFETDIDKLEPADRERLLQALASAYQQLQDDTAARRCFEALAALRPDLLGYRLALYELALRSGDEAFLNSCRLAVTSSLQKQPASSLQTLATVMDLAARDSDAAFQQSILARLREFEGEQGAYWRLAQARQLLANARRASPDLIAIDPKAGAEAARLLKQAIERRPNLADAHAMLGELASLGGDTSAALAAFERAKSLGLRSPELFLNLYRLYADLGRLDQADNQVRELQRLGVTDADPLFQKLVVEADVRGTASLDQILARARAAAPENSTDYRDHLWLSQVCEAANEPAQAEAALRRAAQLNPAEPLPWVSLVRLLARQNQLEKAREVRDQAAQSTPQATRALTLAQCDEALGDIEAASSQYEAALQVRPDDPTLLRLVAAFALQNRQFDRAQAMLKQLAALPTETPEDRDWTRRTLAITLAASGEPANRAEALKLMKIPSQFDQFLPDPSTTVEELQAQFQVLSLQPFPEARKAAIRILQDLVDRRNAGTQEDQLLLAQLLEGEGQWPQARSRMVRLIASSPDDPRYLTQHASWLLDSSPWRDHYAPAEAAPLIDRLQKLAPQSIRTLALRAQYAKAVNRPDEILPDLAAFGEQQPAFLSRVAELQESLGRPDLAEISLRRYIEKDQQPAAALFLLAQFLERQRKLDQAEATLKQFAQIVKQPEAALDLASFLARSGRVAEALDLCEASWATCRPENVAAATTLAVNRAGIDPALAARAEKAIRQALEAAPSEPALLLNLATLHILQDRFDQAEALYRRMLEANPEDPDALQGLSWLIAAHDPARAAEALTLADRAIARLGVQPQLLDLRAFIQIRLQEPRKAVADLQQALLAAPEPDPLWLVHLSQAHLLADAPELAARALSWAREAGLDEAAIPALEKPGYKRLVEELSLVASTSPAGSR